MSQFASGVGLIPEQDWELPNLAASPYGTDPTVASIGFRDGGPAGSAAPLTWSAASYVRLAADLAAGAQRRPAGRHLHRYVAHTQGATTLTVTAPPTKLGGHGSPVTVTGTTAPGNTGLRRRHQHRRELGDDDRVSTTAGPDGSFSVPVAVTGGTSVLNIVAVSPSGATAHDQRTRRLRLRPRHRPSRRHRPDRRRQRAGQLRLPDRRTTSTPAPSI